MRATIFVLLLLISQTSFAVDLGETDKQLHFMALATLSYGAYAVARNYKLNKFESALIGMGFALTIGVLKELNDNRYDNRDMQANALGASVGVLVPVIFIEY